MQKFHSIAAIILVLPAQPALSAEITGRVVGITDGDTLKVLTPAHDLIKIRLPRLGKRLLLHILTP
jgi:endonuclease YncB( thermonuclease family)